MIEEVLIRLLNTAGFKTFTEVEDNMPEAYVIIERTGNSRNNKISKPIVAFRCCSESMYKAAELCESLEKFILEELPGQENIAGVTLNTDYNYTDTETKTYRYCALFVFTYHGAY